MKEAKKIRKEELYNENFRKAITIRSFDVSAKESLQEADLNLKKYFQPNSKEKYFSGIYEIVAHSYGIYVGQTANFCYYTKGKSPKPRLNDYFSKYQPGSQNDAKIRALLEGLKKWIKGAELEFYFKPVHGDRKERLMIEKKYAQKFGNPINNLNLTDYKVLANLYEMCFIDKLERMGLIDQIREIH